MVDTLHLCWELGLYHNVKGIFSILLTSMSAKENLQKSKLTS